MEEIKIQKFKILICDDRKISAETVIANAFKGTFDEDIEGDLRGTNDTISRENLIELAHRHLDITWCKSVTEALETLENLKEQRKSKKQKDKSDEIGDLGVDEKHTKVPIPRPFDLAWVDINFEESEQHDDYTIEAALRGLLIIELLKKEWPQTMIKVHTRMTFNINMMQKIAELGLNIPDIATVFDTGSVVVPFREQLTDIFRGALQRAAASEYYNRSKSSENKRQLDSDIHRVLALKTNINSPLEALGGFSLLSLMIGWCEIIGNTPQLPADGEIQKALTSLKQLREQPKLPLGGIFAPNKPGFTRITSFRGFPNYANLYEGFKERATIIIKEYFPIHDSLRNWQEFANENIGLSTLQRMRNLQETIPNLPPIQNYGVNGILERTPELERGNSNWQEIMGNILTARLVVIGLLELKKEGFLGKFPYPIDLTILLYLMRKKDKFIEVLDGKIRNQDDIDHSSHQIFYNILGFSGVLKIPQEIYWDAYLPEEQAWVISGYLDQFRQVR
jgi:hypothetical protein